MTRQTCPMSALEVLDAGFLETRYRLLEVAALLRCQRCRQLDLDGGIEVAIAALVEQAAGGCADDLQVARILAGVADAVAAIAREVAAGRLDPGKVSERTVARFLDEPDLPDVDLFIRSSGEQRTSNFLLWQSAYAEMVFVPTLWPDFDRTHLWRACEDFARRDRRYGAVQQSDLD